MEGAVEGKGAHSHCCGSLQDITLGPVLPCELSAPRFLEVGLLRCAR